MEKTAEVMTCSRDRPLILTDVDPGIEARHGQRAVPIIGSHVAQAAAHCSTQLTRTGHSSDVAVLPSGLTLTDASIWQSAHFVRQSVPAVQPSTNQLATILKVAEVLQDSHLAGWLDLLATRVRECQWDDADEGDALRFCLLGLPRHLQQRVLRHVVCDTGTSVDDALGTLPDELHPAALVAYCTTDSVTLPKSEKFFRMALTQLRARAASATKPGPHSLIIPHECNAIIAQDAYAELLARALSAASSLTSVKFRHVAMSSHFIHQLRQGLQQGALPHLVELDITMRTHPAGCAELARCLKHFPALTRLATVFLFTEPYRGAGPSLKDFAGLGAGPALLSDLKQLQYAERHHFANQPFDPSSHTFLPRFLEALSTPAVTALSLSSDAARGSTQAIVVALCRMPELCEVDIDADMLPAADAPPVPAHHNPACTAMPRLQRLAVESSNLQTPVSMASAIIFATSASLTSLSLTRSLVWPPEMCLEPDAQPRAAQKLNGADVRDAWGGFLPRFRACSGLKCASILCLCSSYDGVTVQGYSDRLCTALQQLPNLCELTLDAMLWSDTERQARCELKAAALGQALRHHTALWHLIVVGGISHVVGNHRVTLLEHNHFSHLRCLIMGSAALSDSNVADLCRSLPCLKIVTVINLKSTVPESKFDIDVELLKSQFPGLQFDVAVCDTSRYADTGMVWCRG